jgi:coronin-1B/1C/6
VEPTHAKIIGHNGPVLDFNFYPFDDDIIATGSEDSMLRLWRIPDDFVK